jgi:heat shock protein HslJ
MSFVRAFGSWIGCLVLALLIGGCANPAGDSGLTLTGPVWTLVALGERVVEPTDGAPALTLQFDGATSRAAGFAGVNRYSGEFMLDGARLTFGPAVLTKMAGPPERMELERRFTAALAATTRWRIRERHLELLAGDDYVLAKFAVGSAN